MNYQCALCGRQTDAEESNINGYTLCHPDEGRDCYREVQMYNLHRYFSMPQRFMLGADNEHRY